MTWTVFNFTCGPAGDAYCSSEIYGSMSTDHALTWSRPEVISGANAQLCQFGDFFTHNPSDATACNFDQGSDPIALPNGDVVVAFNNGNTPTVDNQQLSVHCHPAGSSTAGTAHLNCSPPTFVGNDVLVGAPVCNFGRFCIPGHYIRTNDYPQDRSEHGQRPPVRRLAGLPQPGVGHPDGALLQRRSDVDAGRDGQPRPRPRPLLRGRRHRREGPSSGFAQGAKQTCGPAGNELCMGDYVLAGGTDTQVPFEFKVVAPPFGPPDGIQAGFKK